MAKTKTGDKAGDADVARKIWLAGVGAYDRMYSETQGAAGKIAKSATDAFHQLVEKGEEVEDAVRARIAASPQGEKISTLMEAWASRAQKLTEEQAAALQDRIAKVTKSVSDTLAPWNLAALGQAVEKLTGHVENLHQEVKSLKTTPTVAAKAAAPKAVKKPAAKPAAKPKAAKAAAKPAAKKAAKPAAKKAPAKKAAAKK